MSSHLREQIHFREGSAPDLLLLQTARSVMDLLFSHRTALLPPPVNIPTVLGLDAVDEFCWKGHTGPVGPTRLFSMMVPARTFLAIEALLEAVHREANHDLLVAENS